MRFLRLGPSGAERPAVMTSSGDQTFDISLITKEIDGAFLAGEGVQHVRRALAQGALPPVDSALARRGPPIARPGKVIVVGLNYRAHEVDAAVPPPPEPILFMKGSDTISGPNDTVLIPRGGTKMDYEVELAVVIGKRARYLSDPQAAAAVIAGYTIANDLSERAFQLDGNGGQWLKGKSCETFNPLGPWLMTSDELPDPQHLRLRCWVNGELRQDSNTSYMHFGVHHLVWYASQFMALEPGDVIDTGTPAGVAHGLPGRPYLRAGDVIDLEVDRLGHQRQRVAQA